MKHHANYSSMSGSLTITARSDDSSVEVLYRDSATDYADAAAKVREQGYKFVGYWVLQGDWGSYKAPLEAISPVECAVKESR